MKKVFSTLVMLLCLSGLFAAEGLLWGEKNIRVVKTEWFDIIYPESCMESAKVLYENADSIYESLSEMYSYPIPCRLPVVLTSKVETYNAYWTNSAYNRIVLYVAPPIDECNVESDSLLKTFHHELTHAFSYNMKTPFYRWIGKVFGDAINVAYWNVTSGLAEGATVSSESYDGEGRLNDEFAKQMVKQAKLEGKFPAFNDVQGSRDAYPVGSYYFFNGAFHEWLQKKYGFEPYVKWWINCVNLKAITIRRAFYKAYGVKLIDSWKQFIKEYEVPNIEANPVKAGIVQDFYDKTAENYSISNSDGGRPFSLSLSEKGLTYVLGGRSAIYYVPSKSIISDTVKPKKILTDYYLEEAHQSADGRFIALTTEKNASATNKYVTQIYDTERKSIYTIKGSGLKNCSIIQDGGKYYLVGLKFVGEDYKIKISELELKNNKISGEASTIYIPFTRKQLPASFVDCGNGTFAFVLKDELEYSICFANLKGEVLNQVQVPFERMVVRYLSYSAAENTLYFSWTKPGSMPRLGKYLLNNNSFALSEEDLSGGVYYPVKFDDKILYVGEFYESNKLLMMDDIEVLAENFTDDDEIAAGSSDENSESESEIEKSDSESVADDLLDENGNPKKLTVNLNNIPLEELDYTDLLAASKKYKGVSYYKRGIVYPFSSYVSKGYISGCNDFRLPLGITYTTGDPAGIHSLKMSAGYGYLTNSAGVNMIFSGGSDTSVFRYSTQIDSEFDRYGWKNAELTLKESTTFDFGRISTFGMSPISRTWIGRHSATESEFQAKYAKNGRLYQTDSQVFMIFNKPLGAYECVDMEKYIYNIDMMMIYYSNIHKVQNNSMNRFGIEAGFAPYYLYNGKLDKSESYAKGCDVSFFALGYIPQLLPFKCYQGFTYNLPLKIVAGLFSANSIAASMCYTYQSFPTLGFIGGEMVLFASEIQKAIPFLPFIYLNNARITLNGMYGANYNANTVSDTWRFLHLKKYFDEMVAGNFESYGTVSLKATLGVVPSNFGSFASSYAKFDTFISGNLVIKKGKTVPKFDFGTDISF